jgi:hypothetical protein
MAIEINHLEHDRAEYKVLGNATLPELHIAFARGERNPFEHVTIRLDLRLANIDAGPREIERFVGYVESVLLPRLTPVRGRFVVRANDNPMENGTLPLTRALVELSRRAATLQVFTTSGQDPTGPEPNTPQKPSESLAQRIKRLTDEDTLAATRKATDADLPAVASADVAYATAV